MPDNAESSVLFCEELAGVFARYPEHARRAGLMHGLPDIIANAADAIHDVEDAADFVLAVCDSLPHVLATTVAGAWGIREREWRAEIRDFRAHARNHGPEMADDRMRPGGE